MVGKQKTVAIAYDSQGKPCDILQVKTIDLELLKPIESDVKKAKAEKLQVSVQKEKARNEKDENRDAKEILRCLVIAKNYFDNLVDKGICETNDDFEKMFDAFMLGGVFNDKLAPYEFKKVLERIR